MRNRNFQVLIIIVVVLILISIIWPSNFLTKSLESAGAKIINPIKGAIGRSILKTENFFGVMKDIKKLSRLNTDLEQQNRDLIVKNSQMTEVAKENEILRSQLGFVQEHSEMHLIACEVVGRDPNNFLQYITLGKGSADGIKAGMPVISQGFLVGKIVELGKRDAKVLLITNPTSVVNALVQRTRSTGIVKGDLGNGLLIDSIAQDADIKESDLVITSGLGGMFPKGLVIGKISEVENQKSMVFKRAAVAAGIDFSNLEVVFVIAN